MQGYSAEYVDIVAYFDLFFAYFAPLLNVATLTNATNATTMILPGVWCVTTISLLYVSIHTHTHTCRFAQGWRRGRR